MTCSVRTDLLDNKDLGSLAYLLGAENFSISILTFSNVIEAFGAYIDGM